ncbi:MAG TPA: hypothetical protein VGI82_06695 [Chitinophagaceae bacterium]|jgi:hypothetical protein
MKKLFVILLSMIIVLSASAQRKFGGGHYYRPRTRVVVGVGAGYYPYGYSYGYGPWGYPYYGYPLYGRPSRLEMRIQDIRADYRDRIWSARHDKSIARSQRKKEIHQLKSERDAAIRDAERNYHRSPNTQY